MIFLDYSSDHFYAFYLKMAPKYSYTIMFKKILLKPVKNSKQAITYARFLNHLPDPPQEFEIYQLSNICMLG